MPDIIQSAYVDAIRKAYAEAEQDVIQKVARRVARGITDPGWAEKKLAEIRAFRKDIGDTVADLKKYSPMVEQMVEQAAQEGAAEAIAQLKRANLMDIEGDVQYTGRGALRELVKDTVNAVEATHQRILRSSEDAYREVIADATRQSTIGNMTIREAAQKALNRFAEMGVTGFVDSLGRHWNLASYTEMATRTATSRAYRTAHTEKLLANGEDLVIISDSPEECELCRPWEGRVLSLTGNTEGYPTRAEAINAGLFHAQCTHRQHLYVPGLTQPYKNTENPMGYKERMQQRYNERQIRRWKNRVAAAIDPKEKSIAQKKLKEWQAAQREFIKKTGRRRDSWREQVRAGKVGVVAKTPVELKAEIKDFGVDITSDFTFDWKRHHPAYKKAQGVEPSAEELTQIHNAVKDLASKTNFPLNDGKLRITLVDGIDDPEAPIAHCINKYVGGKFVDGRQIEEYETQVLLQRNPIYRKAEWFSTGDSWEGTIRHEIAHRYGEVDKDLERRWRDVWYASDEPQSVSKYATFNSSEGFSELTALMTDSNLDKSKVAPNLVKFFDDYIAKGR